MAITSENGVHTARKCKYFGSETGSLVFPSIEPQLVTRLVQRSAFRADALDSVRESCSGFHPSTRHAIVDATLVDDKYSRIPVVGLCAVGLMTLNRTRDAQCGHRSIGYYHIPRSTLDAFADVCREARIEIFDAFTNVDPLHRMTRMFFVLQPAQVLRALLDYFRLLFARTLPEPTPVLRVTRI